MVLLLLHLADPAASSRGAFCVEADMLVMLTGAAGPAVAERLIDEGV